jgi:hypothetical protein
MEEKKAWFTLSMRNEEATSNMDDCNIEFFSDWEDVLEWIDERDGDEAICPPPDPTQCGSMTREPEHSDCFFRYYWGPVKINGPPQVLD